MSERNPGQPADPAGDPLQWRGVARSAVGPPRVSSASTVLIHSTLAERAVSSRSASERAEGLFAASASALR